MYSVYDELLSVYGACLSCHVGAEVPEQQHVSLSSGKMTIGEDQEQPLLKGIWNFLFVKGGDAVTPGEDAVFKLGFVPVGTCFSFRH